MTKTMFSLTDHHLTNRSFSSLALTYLVCRRRLSDPPSLSRSSIVCLKHFCLAAGRGGSLCVTPAVWIAASGRFLRPVTQ